MRNKRSTNPEAPEEGKDAAVGSILKPDEILQASPESFRVELRRVSRDDEPARWAAEHLKLGAVLRIQARRQVGTKRVRTLGQAIDALEEALRYYCKLGRTRGDTRHVPSSDLPPGGHPTRDSNDAGIELILSALRQPLSCDITAIEDALELFTEGSVEDTRSTSFREWLATRVNRGCALTLLGKIRGAQGDSTYLERAVLACQDLLAEPLLRELPADCALVYINLADALCSLGHISGADERARYFESAVDSLAMALRQVVPAGLAPLIEPRPIASN